MLKILLHIRGYASEFGFPHVSESVQASINNHLNLQEGEDIWEDDCSVSESSSIYGSHRPNTHIREFKNPHYNDGDSGSNLDGKSFHLSANS